MSISRFRRPGRWVKKDFSSSRVLRMLRLGVAPQCTAMQRKRQRLSSYVSKDNTPCLLRSQSGRRPRPRNRGCRSKITLTYTALVSSYDHLELGRLWLVSLASSCRLTQSRAAASVSNQGDSPRSVLYQSHRAVVFNVSKLNPRGDLQLEPRSNPFLNAVVDLGGDGAFKIQPTKHIELDLQSSPAFYNLRGLWKVVNSDRTLARARPEHHASASQRFLIATTRSPWGSQFSIHSPGSMLMG